MKKRIYTETLTGKYGVECAIIVGHAKDWYGNSKIRTHIIWPAGIDNGMGHTAWHNDIDEARAYWPKAVALCAKYGFHRNTEAAA